MATITDSQVRANFKYGYDYDMIPGSSVTLKQMTEGKCPKCGSPKSKTTEKRKWICKRCGTVWATIVLPPVEPDTEVGSYKSPKGSLQKPAIFYRVWKDHGEIVTDEVPETDEYSGTGDYTRWMVALDGNVTTQTTIGDGSGGSNPEVTP